MNTILSFEELIKAFGSMSEKRKVAVICPSDECTREMVVECLRGQLAKFLIVYTDEDRIWSQQILSEYPETVEIIASKNDEDACALAVSKAKVGKVDVLMKGLVNTDTLLRAVLDKNVGLLPHGKVLTHVTAIMIPGYGRMILFSDAAVIPNPTLEQLDAMVDYGVAMCRKMNIQCPKVALIHFSEKSSKTQSHTISYESIKRYAREGRYGDVCIDGPMDVKTACDAHSAAVKGLTSSVTGSANLLIFPNLVAANTFYKALALFAQASTAAIVCGADVPIVVPSRADSTRSKLCSLALACVAGISN